MTLPNIQIGADPHSPALLCGDVHVSLCLAVGENQLVAIPATHLRKRSVICIPIIVPLS